MSQRLTARLLQERRSSVVRRELLCHSAGGNVCDLLTVTDFTSPPAEVAARKVVVISARVHPGETNASWMMDGLLDAVTADTAGARALRRSLLLKIVPMLNPDGVILGNYRCSVAGVDLNRQWADPNETSHPTIYHLKRLMRGYVSTDQLLLFCDLHGHSRKRNIFAYGCEALKGPHRLRERVFPRLLADCSPHFSLGGCSYKVLRSKETTGRVVVWRQFSLPNSFTLEASFCGADFGPGAGGHYTIAHLREMGAAFVPALLELTDPTQARVGAILADLEQQFPAAEGDDADECDNADGADGGAPGPRAGDAVGEASEKLRRAVRGARARNPVSASKGGAGGGSSASSGGTGGSKSGAGKHAGDKKHDKKGDPPVKKKKGASGGNGAGAGSCGPGSGTAGSAR